jgi:hypothetical protein
MAYKVHWRTVIWESRERLSKPQPFANQPSSQSLLLNDLQVVEKNLSKGSLIGENTIAHVYCYGLIEMTAYAPRAPFSRIIQYHSQHADPSEDGHHK